MTDKKKATKVVAASVAKKPKKAVKASAKAPAKTLAKTPVKASVKVSTKAPAKASAKIPVKAPAKTLPNKATKNVGIVDASPNITPYALQKSEEYMSAAQCVHFKELLQAWRATLMSKIDTAVMHLKDEPKHFADLNDRASQEEEFNLELRARDREAGLVGDIDEALKRLAEGEYGYCEECGVEIGLRRLEARLTATLCIDCKTLAEVKERQSGL